MNLDEGSTVDKNEKSKYANLNKRSKNKVIKYQGISKGVKNYIHRLIHRSWITNIKYYDDLKYVLSSSVDSLIHIHSIDDLEYKEEKSFNIH